MDQATIAVFLLIIVTALIIVIFSCLYYLWGKTTKLEVLAKKKSIQCAACCSRKYLWIRWKRAF